MGDETDDPHPTVSQDDTDEETEEGESLIDRLVEEKLLDDDVDVTELIEDIDMENLPDDVDLPDLDEIDEDDVPKSAEEAIHRYARFDREQHADIYEELARS